MKQEKRAASYTECTINNPFHSAPFYYVQSTTSTMDDARSFAADNAVHGTVVCAGFQTKGRGRFGNRRWISAPGENLLFTLILKKNAFQFPFSCIPVMTGLALCLVCEEQFGFFPQIKWPNDILFNGKKLAGILCESENENIFCGIGMNCNQEHFPDHLQGGSASIFAITGNTIEVVTLCENILSAMNMVFTRSDWLEETGKRLYKKGDKVRIHFPGREKSDFLLAQGVLYGLDTDGSLLVLEQGAVNPVRVIAGEIEFI